MDTVIVNGYDFMWDDINVESNDPNPFFFKRDPIQYLAGLKNNNWRIILCWISLDVIEAHMQRYPYDHIVDAKTRIIDKRNIIINLFAPFAEMVYMNRGETIADYIKRDELSSSSFTITHIKTQHFFDIAQYSPIEIFELPDEPPIIPNAQYYIIASERARLELLIEKYHAKEAEPSRNMRQYLIYRNKKPGIDIIIIWSPTYRYSQDIKYNNVKNPIMFDRPDQDNQPGVQYYNYGY